MLFRHLLPDHDPTWSSPPSYSDTTPPPCAVASANGITRCTFLACVVLGFIIAWFSHGKDVDQSKLYVTSRLMPQWQSTASAPRQGLRFTTSILSTHPPSAEDPQADDSIAEQWELALRDYNSHTNIYSREAYDKLAFHVEDSWRIGRLLSSKSPVLDLGSGSGLPSVFVAATIAPADVYAIESKSRKTRFLRQVKSSLGLDNLHIITSDVTELCRNWAFDVKYVTAKAFKKLPEVIAAAEDCVAGPSTLIVPISAAQKADTMGLGGRVEEDGNFLYFLRNLRPSRRAKRRIYRGEQDDP